MNSIADQTDHLPWLSGISHCDGSTHAIQCDTSY